MTYQVLCPDGIDRLKTNWDNANDAIFDAGYMSNRSSCFDWCGPNGNHECPGGRHYVLFPKEPELEFT